MALELHYTPSKTHDYTVPETVVIQYKEITYTLPIRTMPSADYEQSVLRLMSGTKDLGSCLFYPEKTSLQINTIISRNMIRNDVHMIKFREAIRPADRVPVGTLLVEAIKQIAQYNDVKTIQLLSMENAKTFYEKKGFRETNGKELVYEYSVPKKSRHRHRHRRSARTRRR